LTLRVDNDPETVRNSDATDASNKGFCLCSARADANGPKVIGTNIANLDIITAGGEIKAG